MYPFFLAPQQGYGVFQVWIFLLPHDYPILLFHFLIASSGVLKLLVLRAPAREQFPWNMWYPMYFVSLQYVFIKTARPPQNGHGNILFSSISEYLIKSCTISHLSNVRLVTLPFILSKIQHSTYDSYQRLWRWYFHLLYLPNYCPSPESLYWYH